MQNLNDIEIAILESIIDENEKEFPFLKEHFSYLYVKSRENTGVGFYVNFGYNKNFPDQMIDTLLSSQKTLTFKNCENELSYVLDIENGKIQVLEIVTNGNDTIENETGLSDFNFA